MDYKERHFKARFTKKITVVVGFGYMDSDVFIPLGQTEIEMDVDDSNPIDIIVNTTGFTVPYLARTARLVTHFGFLFDTNWLVYPIEHTRVGFGPTVITPRTIIQFNSLNHSLPEPTHGEDSLSESVLDR